MSNTINSELFNRIISEENIYNAIYGLDSYIFERNLLSEDDLKRYYRLKDKYDSEFIKEIIFKCKNKLEEVILDDSKLFDIQVFFKIKKYVKENDKVIFRPVHSADLVTQICIVCLLNVIAFDDRSGKRQLSDVSELIPSNFYGNIPSTNVSNVFYSWKEKYKEYTKKVVDTYNLCEKTGKYKFEVCLDLKNFFPSVNPNFIYSILLKKLEIVYKEDEEILKRVLKKTLVFNVLNLQGWEEEYYGDQYEKIKINMKSNKIRPSLGIPQGLPQSYFYGNICMAEIAEITKKYFEGEAFYYVDDTVIYTNDEAGNLKNFIDTIKKLNIKVNKHIEDKINPECREYNYLEYNVLFHEKDKSTFSNILVDEKYGRRFLREIIYGVSTVTFDIATAIDDLQDETIKEKIALYLTAIEREIIFIRGKIKKDEEQDKEEDESKKSYLKLLFRYKKFFKYRLKILDFKKEDYTVDNLKIYYNNYLMNNNELSKDDRAKIFDTFDEEIFSAEASLLIKYAKKDEFAIDVIKRFVKFEEHLTMKINMHNLYFSKVIENQKIDIPQIDYYKNLKLFDNDNIDKFRILTKDKVFKAIEEIVEEYKNGVKNINQDIIYLGYKFDHFMKFIINNSDKMKREILNSILSKIFYVTVSDELSIFKYNGRTLEYYELRILVFLRNKSSKSDEAINFINKVTIEAKTERTQEKVDYSIMEVLDIFNTYVKEPYYIDQLIITHKYIMSVWKNGSKHLYFYTLHNQEHSVELISSCVSICKSIDFLKVKNIDYYILFLACYFHDISMIIQPDPNKVLEDDYQARIILNEYNQLLREIENSTNLEEKNNKIYKLILKSYKEMESFLENLVRSNHTKDSAYFIRKYKDLKYIEPTTKDIVAKVSEAHGYNEWDVYGIKSTGELESVNVKFLMILLRLADLMDMSKDRVSINIMKLNIGQMDSTSQFHWISHAAIDRCNIKSTYEYSVTREDVATYLDKDFFIENCEIHLFLNTQNLMSINKIEKCEGIKCKLNKEQDEITIKMMNKSNDEIKCDNQCNLMCRWMNVKNEYLINELKALDRYVSRNNDNNFMTNFYVKIHMVNSNRIEQSDLDKVLDYLKV